MTVADVIGRPWDFFPFFGTILKKLDQSENCGDLFALSQAHAQNPRRLTGRGACHSPVPRALTTKLGFKNQSLYGYIHSLC